jgi:hypothetical protein
VSIYAQRYRPGCPMTDPKPPSIRFPRRHQCHPSSYQVHLFIVVRSPVVQHNYASSSRKSLNPRRGEKSLHLSLPSLIFTLNYFPLPLSPVVPHLQSLHPTLSSHANTCGHGNITIVVEVYGENTEWESSKKSGLYSSPLVSCRPSRKCRRPLGPYTGPCAKMSMCRWKFTFMNSISDA